MATGVSARRDRDGCRGEAGSRAGAGLGPGRSLSRRRTIRASRPTSRQRPTPRPSWRADYKGRLAELDGDGLAALIERYEAIEDRHRPGRRPSRSCCSPPTATIPRSAGSTRACRSGSPRSARELLFVTLELNKLEDAPLAAMVASRRRASPASGPGCDTVRSFRPHQLADEVERTLHEKYVTGRSAWVRPVRRDAWRPCASRSTARSSPAPRSSTCSRPRTARARGGRGRDQRRAGEERPAVRPDHEHAGQGQADRGRAGASSSARSPRATSPTRSRTRWSTR